MISTRFENQTPELFQKLEAAVSRFVKTVSEEAAERARTKIKTAPRPSRPGGPPAVGSGKYLDSIRVVMENSLEAKVGAGVPYASILEEGRPVWGPVLTGMLPTLEQRLTDELSRI